jgi:hypothetical protein
MTTRRKVEAFKLGAYDYLAAHMVVVKALQARGESPKMTPTELSMITMMTEVCAERGMNLDRATPHLLEVAEEIIRGRCATLFPAYDERDVMGDETIAPTLGQADGVAA